MAKIRFSALVNDISGSLNSSVCSMWKGLGIVKRKNPHPRQPRSEKQQDIRGLLNELAGEWYSLTTVQQSLWNSWVAMTKAPMTGLNAYCKFNQILQKYLPGSSRRQTPPPTPATPTFPTGFTVTPVAGGDFCVIWTAPTLTTLYVVADYWPMPGLDITSNPRWTFGATAGSDATFVDLDIDMPTSTVVKFRIRSIDSYGRTSPWSHILITTALAP
jgi:hypothetical protein